MDRREAIAEAAVEIIASGGLRGLTHRAVDRKLGVPQGSTSNYARTRRDLIILVVGRLTERTLDDVAAMHRGPRTVESVVDDLIGLFDRLLARPVDARARFALTVELTDDPPLHALLTSKSSIRGQLVATATSVLSDLGIAEPQARAIDLVGLMDGLLYDRLAGEGLQGDPIDGRHLLTAWLVGSGAEQQRH